MNHNHASSLVPTAKRPAHPSSSSAAEASAEPPQVTRTSLDVSVRTFVKIGIFAIICLAIYRLWPLISVVIISVLLAGALKPAAARLQKHMPRWTALLILVSLFIAGIVGLLALIIPALASQLMELGKNLPGLQDSMLKHLPSDPKIQNAAKDFISGLTPDKMGPMLNPLLSTGGVLLGGVGEMLLVIVIAFYMVADEGGVLKWAFAFFKPDTRLKCEQTVEEFSDVIFSYVTGQAIISFCVMVFTFTVLTLLGVPGAVVLALLAGIMDVLPVLGFIISGVPAVLLALSVSLPTSLAVLGLYVVYHGIENYLLVPRVYGKSLRVSALSVLLGLLAGMLLGGVPGAIVALPIVASYPIVERIWLADYLGQRVVRKHEAQKDEQFGKEE